MKKWVKIELEKYRKIVSDKYSTIYWSGTKSFGYPEQFFDDVNQYYQNIGILTYKNHKNRKKQIFVYIGVGNKENKNRTIYYDMKVKENKFFLINYSYGIRMIDTPQEALNYINEKINKIEKKLIKKGFSRI